MNNKLFLRMKMLSHDEVISTFVAYQRSENGATEKGRKSMIDNGYEEVKHDGLLLPDGREVIDMWGKRWALSKDRHDLKLSDAMMRAKLRDVAIAASNPKTSETKSVAGTDGLAKMICPKCGDSLQYSVVCGACAAGRAGYRHRYTCVHGCVDFVSKEKI